MRLLQIAEFAVLSLSLSFAPPADNPKKSVRFPDVAPAPLPPAPTPKPDPAAQIPLNEGELYVVEGDPFEIRAYPPGIVSVAKSGPGRVFGKFVGGSGKYEWKEFTAPCVAIVQATANGSVTLVVRPGDAKSEADWIDRSIRSNVGPQPPPKPDPEPIPPPKPKPPEPETPDAELLAKLKTAVAKDQLAGSAKAKAADMAAVYGDVADLLALKDPAVAPKTVGEMYSKAFTMSVDKKIPRRPYLAAVRDVIEEYLGSADGEAPLTDELRKAFQSKYRAISVALAEASK